MFFSAWVEIDLDALGHNIGEVRRLVGDDLGVMFVVKADAYGHGAVEVARVAVQSGVDMLGVATLQEGIELRQAGIAAPILILSPPMESETPDIVEYDLCCTVPSLAIARALSRAAGARSKAAAVHVEVDTGMGRSGVEFEDAIPFITAVSKLPDLVLEGVFTHFPSSDEDPDYTRRQVERFLRAVDRLSAKGVAVPLVHAANSGAVLGVSESFSGPLNMVRPGLMIYGLRPSLGVGPEADLVPVMSFKARIAQIRDLPEGHPVSYGRTYVAPGPMRAAVIPAGYGHGMSFRLSNRGEVLIRGVRAPIIGRVTMDVTMVDLSGVPEAAVGDEVVIFGSQGDAEISVDEIAENVGTINYEVICGIGKRVARVYVKSGEPIGMRTLTERRVVGRRRWAASSPPEPVPRSGVSGDSGGTSRGS
ncbi:MAG: alanine racemase [Candidatus Eisenbacteria bacterium]|nr:alanine racemase [Candidatus Eisenbacteria bacterium]